MADGNDTAREALEYLHERAHAFITHWMEDDGNDTEDKARCQETHRALAHAHSTLSKAIAALDTVAADLLFTAAELPDTTAERCGYYARRIESARNTARTAQAALRPDDPLADAEERRTFVEEQETDDDESTFNRIA